MADTDALILGLEIDAVRPVIAEQIQAAGGATQWLQRASSGPQLSASEALAWLGLATSGPQPLTAQNLREEPLRRRVPGGGDLAHRADQVVAGQDAGDLPASELTGFNRSMQHRLVRAT